MEEPKLCILLLSELVVPVTTPHCSQGGQNGENVFTNILKDNLLRFTGRIEKLKQAELEILESHFKSIYTDVENTSMWQRFTKTAYLDTEADIQWMYSIWILVLLRRLAVYIEVSLKNYDAELQQNWESTKNVAAPPMSPDTLSFSEQNTVTKCIQFVVCLGILPYLQPGVGVPFGQRSGFSSLQKEFVISKEICSEEQEWRLMIIVTCLGGLSHTPAVGSLILSRHMCDLLAALLQLVCASTLKQKKSDEKKQSQQVTEVNTETKTSSKKLSADHIQRCEDLLKGLLDKVYPPALVQELLILQGGPSSGSGKGVLVRSPAWLRNVCGRLLSDIIVKPKGIQFVLSGMLGIPSENSGNASMEIDWKKCDAISRIIAHCPRKSASVEDYYKLIAPQVLELLHKGGKEFGKPFLRVATGTITAMVAQHPVLARKLVLTPLLDSLYTCINYDGDNLHEEACIVSENSLGTCLENVHRLFVVGVEPQSVLLTSLQEVLHVLFRLYCSVHTGVSHLKSEVEEVLLCYLKQSEGPVCVQIIKLFAFEDACTLKIIPLMKSNLAFSPGTHGGVKVVRNTTGSDDWENRINCVVDLLVKSKNDQVAAEVFIDLLKELTSLLSSELGQSPSVPMQVKSLLEIESAEDRLMANVMMLSLLANMCDKLGHTCFRSTAQILEFVQATLERCVMVLTNTDDELTSVFGNETVTMAMGLLTAVMSGASEVSSKDHEKTKQLVPLLQRLSEEHQDESVKEMATDLRIAIATHGFVLSEGLKDAIAKDRKKFTSQRETQKEVFTSANKSSSDKNKSWSGDTTNNDNDEQRKKGTPHKKPLIEVVSSTDFAECEGPSEISSQSKDTEELSEQESVKKRSDREYRENYKPGETEAQSTSSLKQAFEELLDPLVPVRGHALISLKRLLEQKDAETLQKQDTLVKIFHENLDHGDTYIYLAAIQGLAVLANRLPDQVIPLLAEEYVNFDKLKLLRNSEGKEQTAKYRSPELRMKLGEVLMKCIRDLGNTAPKYGDVVLRSLLSGTRDTDSLVRASSLSNLGEICKLLRFSLGKVIYEILECVSSLIKSEQDVEVKRAAVLVLSSILQGLGSDTLKVLDSAVKEVYHLLKHVRRREKDKVLLLHTDCALEILDSFMRDYLFPKQTLTKKISVLDPPGQS